MTSPSALAAEGLSVRAGGSVVLARLSLSVEAGEVLGVFGPSGAGKSTLFRALAGEEDVEAGRVLVRGQDVTKLPLWRRARLGLGYLPQTPSVLTELTVEENLAAFRALSPSRGRDPRELLDPLDLAGRAKVRASALSGGERRRLELARVLGAAPRILILDEPFAAMDPRSAERAGRLLREAAEGGAAVILADHHVAAALSLCDRAALLLSGEIAVTASPDAFKRDSLVARHYAAGAGS